MSQGDVFFAATGVTDGELLDGVHYRGRRGRRDGVRLHALPLRHRAPDQRAHDRAKLREIIGERLG